MKMKLAFLSCLWITIFMWSSFGLNCKQLFNDGYKLDGNARSLLSEIEADDGNEENERDSSGLLNEDRSFASSDNGRHHNWERANNKRYFDPIMYKRYFDPIMYKRYFDPIMYKRYFDPIMYKRYFDPIMYKRYFDPIMYKRYFDPIMYKRYFDPIMYKKSLDSKERQKRYFDPIMYKRYFDPILYK